MIKRIWLVLITGILVGLFVASCAGGGSAPELKMAPVSALPQEMRDAPANVQEAYRFAIVNKELLEQIPCFCGCVDMDHQSNYNCYVTEDGSPGAVVDFETHALG
jgi:hypothetical protein